MNDKDDKRLPRNTQRVVVGATVLVLIAGVSVNTIEAQTSCKEGYYLGAYKDQAGQKFSRCERGPINNDWKKSGPRFGETGDKADAADKTLGPDNFSAKWTGKFRFDAGTYVFSTEADDGIRVLIDGVRLIDRWEEGSERIDKQRMMSAGVHEIRVEYFERTGSAMAKFWWRKL